MRAEDIPFVPWKEFAPTFKWKQGEHVLVIGRTGQGKTTLFSKILPMRKYVCLFATKAYDPVLSKQFPDFRIMDEFPRKPQHDRIMLWAKHQGSLRDLVARQSYMFEQALDQIFTDRGWCVAIDETHYMTSELGLGEQLALYQHQARSSNISVVSGVQRPAHVPVITYGSASHAFIGRQNEPADLKRLAQLGGIDSKRVAEIVATLPKHEWLYLDNTGHSDPVRTRLDL